MNWITKNLHWLALGIGAYWVLVTKSVKNVATPGGIVELPTGAYTKGPTGELRGEDIDKVKANVMYQLGNKFSGIVSVFPLGTQVQIAIKGSFDGKPVDTALVFPTVAQALAAAQADSLLA